MYSAPTLIGYFFLDFSTVAKQRGGDCFNTRLHWANAENVNNPKQKIPGFDSAQFRMHYTSVTDILVLLSKIDKVGCSCVSIATILCCIYRCSYVLYANHGMSHTHVFS